MIRLVTVAPFATSFFMRNLAVACLDISGSSNSCDMLIPNCVSGVSSLDCQDGISVSLHEVSSGPLQTSENPGRLMMVSSSIDAVMRHSLGILKIK